MKKRILTVLLILMIFCFHANAGTGIGAQLGVIPPLFNIDAAQTISATIKTDRIPFVFSAKIQLEDKKFSGAGFTSDMWLANPIIGHSIIHFYYGPGLTILYFPKIDRDDYFQVAQLFAATRFVTGINCFLTDFSEIYAQAAVEPGVVFHEKDGVKFRILFPIEAGIRIWF